MTEKRDPNVEAVIARMRERSAKAIAQYRADTTRRDYSVVDWLKEIIDESTDRAIYGRALIEAWKREPTYLMHRAAQLLMELHEDEINPPQTPWQEEVLEWRRAYMATRGAGR